VTLSARKARKKRKGCTQVDDTSDDIAYLKRQAFFDLLRKLGLQSPPSWFFGADNFGVPDMLIIDPASLQAYRKVLGSKNDKEL
jgi:hypothetical protein